MHFQQIDTLSTISSKLFFELLSLSRFDPKMHPHLNRYNLTNFRFESMIWNAVSKSDNQNKNEHIGIKRIDFFFIIFRPVSCMGFWIKIDENMAYQNVITLKINIRINPTCWFFYLSFFYSLVICILSCLLQPVLICFEHLMARDGSDSSFFTLRLNFRLSFYGMIIVSSFWERSRMSLNIFRISKRIIIPIDCPIPNNIRYDEVL